MMASGGQFVMRIGHMTPLMWSARNWGSVERYSQLKKHIMTQRVLVR